MDEAYIKLAQRSKAYWLPIPPEYLTAAGAGMAQWGYFETQFDVCISIYRRNPASAALGDLRPSFKDRKKLLKRIARVVFPNCPSFVSKICDFADRSYDTCKKRNVLIHGHWFDRTHFEPEIGVTISTKADGSGDFYSVSVAEIESLGAKILALRQEAMELSFDLTGRQIPHPYLTGDEEAALQQHHRNYPPPAQPEAPIRRAQNRVGSPQRPEPFRA